MIRLVTPCMESYLPLFPLKLVAFPGEQLNLHIFEPRYKQLMQDIMEGDQKFGVVVYHEKLKPFGTEVILDEIYKVYDDGRMDIKTKGLRVFNLLSFDNPMDGKMYSGGLVRFRADRIQVPEPIFAEFIFYLKELFRLLNFEVKMEKLSLNSFTFAHKIGLNLDQESELLLIDDEAKRELYLIEYLKKVIPVLKDMEIAKKKIQMNGHFKNLDPLDF